MKLNILETTYANQKLAQAETVKPFVIDEEVENQVVNVHPDILYQTFQGFGGTFTEAACYCMKQAGDALTQEILLARVVEQAQMVVRVCVDVNESGRKVRAQAVERFVGGFAREISDGRDAVAVYKYVRTLRVFPFAAQNPDVFYEERH